MNNFLESEIQNEGVVKIKDFLIKNEIYKSKQIFKPFM